VTWLFLLLPRPLRTTWQWIRHPRRNLYFGKKWRGRPGAGDLVIDCRGQEHAVARFLDGEDDLVLDDGYHCSWMHCCEKP
jgi:hypothetical protein